MLNSILKIIENDEMNMNKKCDEIKKVLKKWNLELKTEEFNKNWENSLPFIKELLNMEKPKYTWVIEVSTTFGIPNSNVYMLHTAEPEHNPQFIKTLLSIGAIWKCNFGLSTRRTNITEAINKAFRNLSEQKEYKDIFEKFYSDNEHLKYLYVENMKICLF